MTEELEADTYSVDGQLMMIMPRASASLRNPDVRLPVLRSDINGYYLEMRVDADPDDPSEVAVTRRIPLDDFSQEEWEELQQQYSKLDLSTCVDVGVTKGLEKVQDRRVQRLFMALLTFLNPRQVAVVLYLYREASRQGNGRTVNFRSNDLLTDLGYKRTEKGPYQANLRSQLNRDLVALHRTELVFAQSLAKGDSIGAELTVKSVLRIKKVFIDKLPRDFDLAKSADYTHELADAYTIDLEFFEGPGSDDILLANTGIKQREFANTKRDYRTKLLVYLASRIKWNGLRNEKHLVVSKPYLFKNLDLLGSNNPRNNQIFWRTVDELQADGFIFSALELPGKGKSQSIEFQICSDKLRLHQSTKSRKSEI
jgi:hypothetical protein